MTKPSDIAFLAPSPAAVAAVKELSEVLKPSEVKVEKKRPSTPVRNPAFREHEGLRALQRELNSGRRPKPQNNK